MIEPGSIISYTQMCLEEGMQLQRGMNFRVGGRQTIVLMSRRSNAPYNDRIEDDGRVLVYEGHDDSKTAECPDPKAVDQPLVTASGSQTQNGLFFDAAARARADETQAELVRVYEKIKTGIWEYVGLFKLFDAWQEHDGTRYICRFRMELTTSVDTSSYDRRDLPQTRLIPSRVKQEVWARDGGRCVQCGSTDNLHFDHIIPFAKGGSSLTAENIQLLCARHNLEKSDRIV